MRHAFVEYLPIGLANQSHGGEDLRGHSRTAKPVGGELPQKILRVLVRIPVRLGGSEGREHVETGRWVLVTERKHALGVVSKNVGTPTVSAQSHELGGLPGGKPSRALAEVRPPSLYSSLFHLPAFSSLHGRYPAHAAPTQHEHQAPPSDLFAELHSYVLHRHHDFAVSR